MRTGQSTLKSRRACVGQLSMFGEDEQPLNDLADGAERTAAGKSTESRQRAPHNGHEDTPNRIGGMPGCATLIPLSLIDASAFTLRSPCAADDEGLRGLAASIRCYGLLETPEVRPSPESVGRFEVVIGGRRVAACRVLQWEMIAVTMIDASDEECLARSMAENLQRANLPDKDVLRGITRLVVYHGSQQTLARQLHKSPAWVSKRMRVAAHPLARAAVIEHGLALNSVYDIISTHQGDEVATLLRDMERGQQHGSTAADEARRSPQRRRTARNTSGATMDEAQQEGAKKTVTLLRESDDRMSLEETISGRNQLSAIAHTTLPSSGVAYAPNRRAEPAGFVDRDELAILRLYDNTSRAPIGVVWSTLQQDFRAIDARLTRSTQADGKE